MLLLKKVIKTLGIIFSIFALMFISIIVDLCNYMGRLIKFAFYDLWYGISDIWTDNDYPTKIPEKEDK